MSLQAPRLLGSDLVDDIGQRPALAREGVFSGAVFDVLRDRVDLGGEGGVVNREYVRHPGAVVVVALRPGEHGGEEVFVIRQYRHALGVTEWELPAGLLDVDDEPAHATAVRELAEEADLRAATWHTLAGFSPSPGALDETLRVFLALDLRDVPGQERHARDAEEADLRPGWIDLDAAVSAVLTGTVSNAGLVVGVLAAHAARARDWRTLRPADAPWPLHPKNRP